MSLRRIWTILRKDLSDAIRDGRVLAIIIVPIALGLLYSVIYPDQEPRPTADVVVVGSSADAQRVAEALPEDVSSAIELTVTREPDEAPARTAVEDEDVDLAVVVPDGLLGEAQSGRGPPLRVLIGPEPSPTTQALVQLLPTTVGGLADRAPAAQVEVEPVAPSSPSAFNAVGMRNYFVLAAIVMVIGFIGMLATPIILAEEIEKRTIEALLLAARGPEVLAAKALVGIAYSIVATALTVAVTRLPIEDVGMFLLGALGTVVSIVGLGLCFGYLVRSADKLNTWGWVLLMPFLIPAFVVAIPMAPWLDVIVQALPTAQGMRLMSDGVAGEAVFGGVGIALLVFAVWGGGGLLLLGRLLQTRGS